MTIVLLLLIFLLGSLGIWENLAHRRTAAELKFANEARAELGRRLIAAQRKLEAIERPHTFVIASDRNMALIELNKRDMTERTPGVHIVTRPQHLDGHILTPADHILYANSAGVDHHVWEKLARVTAVSDGIVSVEDLWASGR